MLNLSTLQMFSKSTFLCSTVIPAMEKYRLLILFSIHIGKQMTDEVLGFTTDDVEAALEELKNISTSGPDGVPAAGILSPLRKNGDKIRLLQVITSL